MPAPGVSAFGDGSHAPGATGLTVDGGNFGAIIDETEATNWGSIEGTPRDPAGLIPLGPLELRVLGHEDARHDDAAEAPFPAQIGRREDQLVIDAMDASTFGTTSTRDNAVTGSTGLPACGESPPKKQPYPARYGWLDSVRRIRRGGGLLTSGPDDVRRA